MNTLVPGDPVLGRRDVEPHRGEWLLAMALVALLLPLIGLPISVAVMFMTKTDLAKIRLGLMDGEGQMRTNQALNLALAGLCFHLVWPCMGIIVFLAQVLSR